MKNEHPNPEVAYPSFAPGEPEAEESLQTKEEKESEISLNAYLQPEISPDELPFLKTSQQWTPFFILFKELVRTNLNDFWVKLAVLFLFSQDKNKTRWTPQELSVELNWLREVPRKRIIAQLSRSNWLSYNEGGYQISTFGRSILSMLTSIIHQEKSPDALGANISSLTLLEMYQHDPTNTLRMFLNELVRIDEEIQKTLESKSEYLTRKLNKRLRNQFEVAIKSRKHLENLPTNDFNAYRLKQQIHERLSAFHARLSQVQRIQNDLVARKIIIADQSLSQHDISSFLINSSRDDLAKLGRTFVSVPLTITDLIPQLMVYETEWQMEKEHIQEIRRGWSDVETAVESQENLITHSRFLQFAGEVKHNLYRKEQFTIEEFVPKENWSISCFRFCMLWVLENGDLHSSLGLAGESCPKIKIGYPQDSVSSPVAQLNDHLSGVKELSRGIVSKAEEK